MIAFFANLFGYILNFLYELVGNYGIAIILFSILVKLLMVPISIKQQRTMKKSQKLNEEMKNIQFKYKNDPEKMNQEVMALYKREKMSPFSGCLSAIIQIVLLFSVFYMVRSPLTYMRKVDASVIENAKSVVENDGNISSYKEIAIINYINNSEESKNIQEKNDNIQVENNKNEAVTTEEGKEEFNINDYKEELYINMSFFGLDLSKVPKENIADFKVLIIPILYVISSFISMRLTTLNTKKQKNEEKLLTDGSEENKTEETDPMEQTNKSMSLIMPIMSISIAYIAPLGLALYWLMNNILIIIERQIIDKFIINNETEAKENA